MVAAGRHYRDYHERFTTSVVTVMEMAKGFHKAGRADAIDRLMLALSLHRVLTFGSENAVLAGRILADLDRAGLPVGRADPMIASMAIRHGLVLVTGNMEHFGRIASLGYPLRLDTWHSA